MAEATQWEYRVVVCGGVLRTKDEELKALLNEWGEEGWEVISVNSLEGSNKVRVVAKRPLTAARRRARTMPAHE